MLFMNISTDTFVHQLLTALQLETYTKTKLLPPKMHIKLLFTYQLTITKSVSEKVY
jgi:hypothetical protein